MRRKSLEAAPASSGVLKALLGDEGSGHLQRAEGTPEAWTSLPMGPAGFGADREVPTLVVDDQQLVLLPNLPQRFSPNRAVIWSSSELLLPVNSKHSTPLPMSRTAADRCTRPWPIGQSVQRAPSARCSRPRGLVDRIDRAGCLGKRLAAYDSVCANTRSRSGQASLTMQE